MAGKRAEQRTVGSATLDQHGALVREITGELVAFANEFAARAIERQQALGHVAPRTRWMMRRVSTRPPCTCVNTPT